MSRTRTNFAALLWVFAIFGLNACSPAPNQPLRVGLDSWPGFALFFVAQEKDFFSDEGVNVELVELSSLSDVRRTFERGQIDGLASSLIEVVEIAHAGKRRAVICLMTDYSDGADVILANKQFPDVASLRGHRVGIEPGTLNQLILTRALDGVNLTIDDVEVVSLSHQAMAEALRAQTVDAVITYPPVSTEIQREGSVNIVFSSADIPGEIADVVSFDADIVAHRRADIEAFSRAWARTVRYAKEHPREAYGLLSPHIGMSVEELEEAYSAIRIVGGDEQAEFLDPGGVLRQGVKAISTILWPEEIGLGGGVPDVLFIDQADADLWQVEEG